MISFRSCLLITALLLNNGKAAASMYGESFTGEASVGSHNQLVEQFLKDAWNPVQIKVLQMLVSYVPKASNTTNEIELWSFKTGELVCGQVVTRSGLRVGSISTSVQIGRGVNYYDIFYTGCGNKELFRERLISRGDTPIVLDPIDLLFAERPTVLQSGETSREYQVSSQQYGELYRYVLNRAKGRKSFQFAAQNQVYLLSDSDESDRELVIQMQPVNFSVNFGVGTYQVRSSSRNTYLVLTDANGGQRFFITNPNQELSENGFKDVITNGPLFMVQVISKGLMDTVMKISWPASSFGSSGGANTTLINELTTALEFVQTNRNLEFVSQYIFKLIEAARKDELQDRRQ